MNYYYYYVSVFIDFKAPFGDPFFAAIDFFEPVFWRMVGRGDVSSVSERRWGVGLLEVAEMELDCWLRIELSRLGLRLPTAGRADFFVSVRSKPPEATWEDAPPFLLVVFFLTFFAGSLLTEPEPLWSRPPPPLMSEP